MAKKIILASLLAVLVIALAALAVSCDIFGNGPKDPQNTDDQPAERAAAFFKKFEGTWTAPDDSFIDFSSGDGK
ncbi:MAG: hypothetical protein IKY07_08195, partial [Clostridia bacterium]|nr:hypothetical protein [Clostridia bacterium]